MNILRIFHKLYQHYGPQNWWPADNPLEIIIGALLVQGTNWKNAEKAIRKLEKSGLLNVQCLANLDEEDLANILRPAGFHRIKARRIKNFISKLLDDFNGELKKLFELDTKDLRRWLLEIKGIGKETADNIILYAANKLIFPIDKFTIRILSRLGFKVTNEYDDIQKLIEEEIPNDLRVYKELRALFVKHAKEHCRKSPLCDNCPLSSDCSYLKHHLKNIARRKMKKDIAKPIM